MGHPAYELARDEATFGQRAADRTAQFMGSWRFIWIQTSLVIAWMIINIINWFTWHWDPYPFIFLTLLLSLQASYAAPIIQLAANRSNEKDRIRDQHDYEHGTESLEMLRMLHAHFHGIECVCHVRAQSDQTG